QDLRRIEIWASVDEGDVGRVQPGQDVTFTVTAFPGTTFRGEVMQVRLGPQTIQNVVTYTVVIAADNPDLRLLPGMTATVRIVSDRRDQVLRVPNAALRYRPPGAPASADERCRRHAARTGLGAGIRQAIDHRARPDAGPAAPVGFDHGRQPARLRDA